jgi:aspartokinase
MGKICIAKFGGSQTPQIEDISDRLAYKEIIAKISRLSLGNKQLFLVFSAPGKMTSEIQNLLDENEKLCVKTTFYRIWINIILHKKAVILEWFPEEKLSRFFTTELEHHWEKYKKAFLNMEERGFSCWRNGALVLGEMFQLVIMKTFLRKFNISYLSPVDQMGCFDQIFVNSKKKLRLSKSFAQIQKWYKDEIDPEGRAVVLIPGFAAMGPGGPSNLGLEGSDLTALVYADVLARKLAGQNNVRVLFYKAVEDSTIPLSLKIYPDTLFGRDIKKPLLGGEASKYMRSHMSPDSKIYVQFRGGAPRRLHL